MSMITINFTKMPTSANSMRTSFVRNGKIASAKSKAYAAWKAKAVAEAMPYAGQVKGPYILIMMVARNYRSKRARDIDNLIKPVNDALVSAGVVEDDSLCEAIIASWSDAMPDGVAVIAIVKAV